MSIWMPQLAGPQVRYRAIVEALAGDIAHGRLKAGDRLPPQRALADRLGVNLSTVSRAYQEAARRRLVGGEVGRGTYVLAATLGEAPLGETGEAGRAAVNLSAFLPAAPPDDVAFIETIAGFTPGERRAAGRYVGGAMLGAAREAARRWIAHRGVETRPEVVIPTAGAHAALQLVLTARCVPGESVLVEALTFPGMRVLAAQLGLRLVPVEQDGEGVLPDALAAAARHSGARLAVLVPNLQNPTGAVMGEARRRALAAAVEAERLLVVEDDVFGEIAGRAPLTDLLGPHGVLVSSLSKTVQPGLRFGFAAGPAALLGPLAGDGHMPVWPLSPLNLMVAARWIEDGTAAARSAWQRREVAARWAILQEVFGPTARHPAQQVWLRGEAAGGDIARRARAEDVEVMPGERFAVGRGRIGHVRICLTAPERREELRRALARLHRLGLRH